jgi:hypothetical protein
LIATDDKAYISQTPPWAFIRWKEKSFHRSAFFSVKRSINLHVIAADIEGLGQHQAW